LTQPFASWPAPAKINLFLRVLGQRADGYHRLQTAFQFLAYGDEIRLVVRTDGVIQRCIDIPDVSEASDLTVRAAKKLQSFSGTKLGVDIGVEKRIPLGGGLGGGSSDAATVLVALNQLWRLQLPVDTLAELGLALGADVPVFVRGRAAWGEGVGEHLTPIEFEELWYLVVHPGCHVSTAAVFAAPTLTRNSTPARIPSFPRSPKGSSVTVSARDLVQRIGNDCEALVRAYYPEVDGVLRWLRRFGPARMTGTGAAVFLPLAGEDEGQRLLTQLPAHWRGIVTQGKNRSPLLGRTSANSRV
jgi:4-diphosphocytidyl-2-C-methyl-D-erythritol kinase